MSVSCVPYCVPVLAALLAAGAQAAPVVPPMLLHDGFARFDAGRWIVEAEAAPGDARAATPAVSVRAHALVLDGRAGLTVWLNRRLTGHYEITYTRTVLDRGGPNDRVSDLNQFWLANDPARAAAAAPFGRSGRFADYDSLDMLYAGIGGNDNTTTRVRRYDGTAARPLLAEYTSRDRLLRGNHPYHVRIVVDGAGSRLYLDGRPLFAVSGPLPAGGYFGFRSTASRQTIRDFSIRTLR
ncbi:hypothetical protein GIY62_21140 [Burkholderia plantarii]|uniref:DUF6250 domain-containing protein n=1 Tax=Burkholderia plantarii TaxID=41899 RepID=UPI00272CA7FB|nr:DUF6250 domain-containing protein [Burkholderia plantarii]WLE62879.1 hypothetical protein GIY62_21140 [Burkholderia plantarii]